MERNNYKKRTLPKDFETYANPLDEKSFKFIGKAVIESPTRNLYSFNGKIAISNDQFALKTNQLLLKGSNLRNTEWILGLVVYTGKDTKLMLNSQKSRTKQSHVEKKLNIVIFFILIIQICTCLLLAIIMSIYDSVDDDNQDYYLGDNNSDEKAYLNFFSYFLLLNTMIPISLIVTIEIIKVLQCIYIVWDSEMFSEDDDAGCHVSSTTINEELGQVKYVFSDKTGTLTQNIMEFRALAIEDEMYGSIDDHIRRKASKLEQKLEMEYSFKSPKLDSLLELRGRSKGSTTVITSKSGRNEITLDGDKEKAIESIKLLSICHECMPEVAELDGEKVIFYQGPSPDESTLVDFAQRQGHEFWEVTEGSCTIKYHPESGVTNEGSKIVTYDIHKRMEFTSSRKRMGVFFTDALDGKHKIYIKGADSEIKLRLDKSQINDKHLEFIDDFLARSSVKGLRTLLYGIRVLDEEEFEEFQLDIAQAEDDVLNSERLLEKVYEKWEQEIVLLGGTAVEDRLQDDVPQTLEDLRSAGIKVWMLTGDKMETAKNIGFSCRLLTEDMVITEVKGKQKAKNIFTYSFYEDNKSMMEDLK